MEVDSIVLRPIIYVCGYVRREVVCNTRLGKKFLSYGNVSGTD